MNIMQGEEVGLRTLEAEDAPLLWRWLNDPDVLTYYEGRDRPQSMEDIEENFYDEIGEATLCIIQFMGNDIGYLQFYPLEEEDGAGVLRVRGKRWHHLWNGSIYRRDGLLEPRYRHKADW